MDDWIPIDLLNLDSSDTFDIDTRFPVCRGIRCNEYIVTGLSSAPYESHLMLSLGFKHLTNYGVKVLECSEYRIDEVCRVPLPSKVFQTEWVPSHPQLLAVATDGIRIYEYEDQNLRLKESFLENPGNPVISMDWNTRQPGNMLITRENGECALLSLEYGTPVELIRYTPSMYQYSSPPPRCGARFGTDLITNFIVLIEQRNIMRIFDHQFSLLNSYIPGNDDVVFGMEHHKDDYYHHATLTDKEIYLYDLRYLRAEVDTFSNFGVEEQATSFCWSYHFDKLYIGTSTGAVILWNTDERIANRYYNQNKKIGSVHCPKWNSRFFFLSTCFDPSTDSYPSTIETYSNVS